MPRAILILILAAALPAFAQDAKQVPAGSTASLGQKDAPKANSPQKKLLNAALTPQTRQTLQDAMNSSK